MKPNRFTHRFAHRFASTALVLLALLIVPTIKAQSGKGRTLIVLDASGSMWGQIDGRPKVEIAREVIGGLLATLSPEMEIGLMAYGHREKGNCNDIELLVVPAKGDRSSFLEKVNSIIPKGMTPLTAAVEAAAFELQYEERAAHVILISDGLETCDRDPCALARDLVAKGIAFRTHLVAFDLSSEEAASFRCLADETGGSFLHARDAATLRDALELALEATHADPGAAMPELKLDPATLTVPASVPAGSVFQAEWEGPDNGGDYLTVVEVSTKEGAYGTFAYTRNGSPLELTAPIKPGAAEVRYQAKNGAVLGRAPVEILPVTATIEAPSDAIAGSHVAIHWTGPANSGDYLTIVAKDADEGTYKSYAYTRDGSPLRVRALSDPGEAEIRYVTGQGQLTLARKTITLLEAEVLVSGPESVDAGASFEVKWVGPANQGDYVTIVKRDAAEGAYNSYGYPKSDGEKTLILIAEEEEGDDYELRYVDGQTRKILARVPIAVLPAAATVEGPETAVAGSTIEVRWFGPKHDRWYITVVEKDAAIGSYQSYFYTSSEQSPTRLQTPEIVGAAEIRFMSKGGRLFARAPIELTEAAARFLEVPAQVVAGKTFRVQWEGPDNKRDYITVVEPDAADGQYGSYIYAEGGSDQVLKAPDKAGTYELRYTTQGKAVLARESIRVVSE